MLKLSPDILERHRRHFDSPADGAVVIRGSVQGLACDKLGEGQKFDEQSWVDAGCLAKMFTAAALLRCAERHLVNVHDPVSRYLPAESIGAHARILDGISIADLVNHTHGLDLAVEMPDLLTVEGYIDQQKLFASLKRMARPGKVFLYGFAGPAVVACMLEAITSRPYKMLIPELLTEFGLTNEFCIDETRTFCPAINLGLKVSPLGLAKILQRMLEPRRGPDSVDVTHFMHGFKSAEVKLPDNHFGGDAYCLGWYARGERLSINAHGHNSSVSVMVDLPNKSFWVVAARSPRLSVAYMILSSCLDALGYTQQDRWENKPETPNAMDTTIEGEYESGRFLCRVKRRNEKIGITVTARNSAEVVLQRVVRHQYQNVFQVFPGGGDFMSYLRYEKCEDGEFLIANHHHFKKVKNAAV